MAQKQTCQLAVVNMEAMNSDNDSVYSDIVTASVKELSTKFCNQICSHNIRH